jgi:hypothetical protein
MTFTHKADGSATDITDDNFGGVGGLVVRYREDGELLVYNRGEHERGFAICLACGYADSEKHVGAGTMKLPPLFQKHAPLTSTSRWATCWKNDDVPVLRNQILAARETTDVLLVDFSRCLAGHPQAYAIVTTLGYALQRAGAQLLDLDTREIGVLVVPSGEGGRGHGVVLYDSVAGGAGHVPELLAQGRVWLEHARAVMFVNDAHDALCETACLSCLLSFDAQEVMRQNLLNRRAAIKALDALLGGGEDGVMPPFTPEPSQPGRIQNGVPSAAERLAARATGRGRQPLPG